MSILSSIVNTAGSDFTALSNFLGFNQWQLKDGSYNGCSFVVYVPFGVLTNTLLFSAGNNAINSYNTLTGKNFLGTDPNGVGNLNATNLAALQWEDRIIFQVATKSIPYGRGANLEQTGYGGREFRMSLIYFGLDYQKAINNLQNAIFSPPVDAYNVLVHPIIGEIKGQTLVTDMQVVHATSLYRGAIVNITFRSETVQFNTPNVSDNTTDVVNAIQNAFNLYNSVGSLLSLGYDLSNQFDNDILGLKDSFLNINNYFYKNSSAVGTSAVLDKLAVNYTTLPPLINQSEFNVSTANTVINNFIKQTKSLTDSLKTYTGLTNNIINTLESMIASLNDTAIACLNAKSVTLYTTPYDMSIREILLRNNLDLSYSQDILSKNNLPSANYIPKGTTVLL